MQVESPPLILVKDKLLSDVSTLGIGGPAKYFIEVRSIGELQEALAFCKNNKITSLTVGKGSNCLLTIEVLMDVLFITKSQITFMMVKGLFK